MEQAFKQGTTAEMDRNADRMIPLSILADMSIHWRITCPVIKEMTLFSSEMNGQLDLPTDRSILCYACPIISVIQSECL